LREEVAQGAGGRSGGVREVTGRVRDGGLETRDSCTTFVLEGEGGGKYAKGGRKKKPA